MEVEFLGMTVETEGIKMDQSKEHLRGKKLPWFGQLLLVLYSRLCHSGTTP